MKQELADECDYAREAGFLRRFKEFLKDDPRYKVPWVWEGSTDRVLVMEHVNGVSVGEADSSALSQQDRNDVRIQLVVPLPGSRFILGGVDIRVDPGTVYKRALRVQGDAD